LKYQTIAAKEGKVFSTSNLERFRSFITSMAPVESFRIQLLIEGTGGFLRFDTDHWPKVI
jgi:hypothetical protein